MSTTTEKWTIFGERLKAELERQGMSLRQFSEKTGITLVTACRYVHSQRTPRATEILKAAKALGTTCDYMLGLSDDPHKTRDGWAKAGFHDLPPAQPETHEERTETHACDYINRKDAIEAHYEYCNKHPDAGFPVWSLKILKDLPPAQPEQTNSCYTNSWCIDCKEYDTENKCCPRYNRVIKQTLDDAYMHGETEAEARYHAQQRWIPCSERLPAYGEDVLISIGGYCNVGYIVSVNEEEQYNWYFSGWYHLPNDVDAWMPLPEPYAERRTDG